MEAGMPSLPEGTSSQRIWDLVMRKQARFSPELPEGTQPRQHLDVSPVRLLFRFLVSRPEDKKVAGGILLELQWESHVAPRLSLKKIIGTSWICGKF